MIKNHTYSRTSISEIYDSPLAWQGNSINQNIALRIINDGNDFKELKEKWNILLDQSREPHPFLSWEWQYTWWEVFADFRDELMIIIISNGNEIIAIAPFYIKADFLSKRLMMIGEGEHQDSHVASHYHDIICCEKNSQLAIASIASYLTAKKSWDYSSFSYVLNQSYLFSIMEKISLFMSIKVPFGCQYRIDLGDNFDKKFQTYSKSTKKRFRLKRNRMEKLAELNLLSLNLEDKVEESLGILEGLHKYRQLSKGETSAFSDPYFKKFHVSLIKRLIGTNKAQIRVLKHGDDTVACVLNYVSTTAPIPIIYSYASGFKSEDDKRFSPMFVFDILDFEYSAKQGYSHYDLLSADGDISYKSTYKPSTQPVSRLCWFSLSPQGVIAYFCVKSRRLLSKVCSCLKLK